MPHLKFTFPQRSVSFNFTFLVVTYLLYAPLLTYGGTTHPTFMTYCSGNNCYRNTFSSCHVGYKDGRAIYVTVAHAFRDMPTKNQVSICVVNKSGKGIPVEIKGVSIGDDLAILECLSTQGNGDPYTLGQYVPTVQSSVRLTGFTSTSTQRKYGTITSAKYKKPIFEVNASVQSGASGGSVVGEGNILHGIISASDSTGTICVNILAVKSLLIKTYGSLSMFNVKPVKTPTPPSLPGPRLPGVPPTHSRKPLPRDTTNLPKVLTKEDILALIKSQGYLHPSDITIPVELLDEHGKVISSKIYRYEEPIRIRMQRKEVTTK